MTKPNPIPILTKHRGIGLQTIQRAMGHKSMYITTLHRLAKAAHLTEYTWSRLFDLTMTEWGQCDDREVKHLLWECYFPGSLPHVYHYLHYHFQIPAAVLLEKSGLSPSAFDRRVLRRPKISQRHLQAIAPYAMEYEQALASKKQVAGRDPEYMLIARSLRDPARVLRKTNGD